VKIYTSKNVYEAALERIEYLYREFPNVVVSVSGGKDSTVVLHLCIEVARKLGKLPVVARFLDQEAEWRQTVEYMRQIQAMPEVDLRWYQIEFKIFNATSHTDDFLYCWRDGDEWIRPKEPDAIKENVYGLDRFHDFLEKCLDFEYPDEPACAISGVRCAESPQRAKGLTSYSTYKHITYGHKDNPKKGHYTFYPIYDWEFSDVWHYIAVNGFPYNKVYDLMYRNGVAPSRMRVSNLTHEVAVNSLKDVQDIDRDTWNDVASRLASANSIKHLKGDALECPDELPFMFDSWPEYRDYLLENLVQDPAARAKMVKKFQQCDEKLVGTVHEESLYRAEIKTIIRNDHFFTGIGNFMTQYNKIRETHKRMRRKEATQYGQNE
jgi:predicted phosphoadenosine phosphosulfate sulfurtransferase